MATLSNISTSPDTLVTIKVTVDGGHRRFKIPLRDLGPSVLPIKLRFLLDIPADQDVIFERYSDSAASFVVLDPNDTAIFKQLYRAAKAKLKLRIKANIFPRDEDDGSDLVADEALTTAEAPVPNVTKATATVTATAAAADEKTPPSNGILVETAVTEDRSTTSIADGAVKDQQDCLLEADTAPAAPTGAADMKPDNDGDESHPPQAKTQNEHFFELRQRLIRQSLVNAAHAAQLRCVAKARRAATLPLGCTPKAADVDAPPPSYVVYCNACDCPIRTEYYHCSTCDGGDFDLCGDCIDAGHLCRSDGHWMIKRTFKDGCIINSTTDVIRPRNAAAGTAVTVTVTTNDGDDAGARSSPSSTCSTAAIHGSVASVSPAKDVFVACRCCLKEYSPTRMVRCETCEDYSLCDSCLHDSKHGHNPRHAFKPAPKPVSRLTTALCAPGRGVRHSALCDGCDMTIIGLRHKCLDCPDWDYCSICIDKAPHSHPGHRFFASAEPIQMRPGNSAVHHAKVCDGPLCQGNSNQGYIVGDRYKCAVCHDTDFCENCEASPQNKHNKTHPLIKFKTPIRNVTVCTLGERADGAEMPVMGDIHARNPSAAVPSAASVGPTTVTVSKPTSTANAATQVQTVAEVKPVSSSLPVVPAASVKDVDGHDDRDGDGDKAEGSTIAEAEPSLDAHFVRDTIPDGTMLPPSYIFRQTWTIRNPGPADWPKGCSVKFVGGDNMRNLDMGHPISVADLEKSVESDMLPLDVGTGVNWGFTVTLRTPKRPGKYISYWRLTAPDGVKFGDKLWCDIDVSEDAHTTRPTSATMDTNRPVTAGPKELVKLPTATTEPQGEVDTNVREPGRIENPALFQHEPRGCATRPRRRYQHPVPWRWTDSSRPSSCLRIPLRTSRQRQEELSPEELRVKNIKDVTEKHVYELSRAQAELATRTAEQAKDEGVVANEAEPEPEADIDTVEIAEAEREVKQEAKIPEKPETASATRIPEVDELSSEDEDFLTDEEYDILNASDEEFLAVSQKDARR